MNTSSNFKRLCSAYLNQDFDLEFGSADAAISAFSAHVDDCELAETLVEIERLIAEDRAEDELRLVIFQELGCCYFFPADWSSGVDWLKHVKILLTNKPT